MSAVLVHLSLKDAHACWLAAQSVISRYPMLPVRLGLTLATIARDLLPHATTYELAVKALAETYGQKAEDGTTVFANGQQIVWATEPPKDELSMLMSKDAGVEVTTITVRLDDLSEAGVQLPSSLVLALDDAGLLTLEP